MNSIVSYPDRGFYGKSNYRGNCSGKLIEELFKLYNPKFVIDPAEGSGTCKDVCQKMNIDYRGFDLHSNFNILKESIYSRTNRLSDLLFFHPPYWDIIKYSGNIWGKKVHSDDLSHIEHYSHFIKKLITSLNNCYRTIRPNGYLIVLIGDIRKKGNYYSPQSEIIKWNTKNLKNILIKIQHNTKTENKKYKGKFIPIIHEYVLIFQKNLNIQEDRCQIIN